MTLGSLHPMMPLSESEEWGPHPQGGIFIPLCLMSFKRPGSGPRCGTDVPTPSSHTLKPLPKDRQGDLKTKPGSFQGAERRLPPGPSPALLLLVPNCSLGSTSDESALGLLLCLYFMMFIITLWK